MVIHLHKMEFFSFLSTTKTLDCIGWHWNGRCDFKNKYVTLGDYKDVLADVPELSAINMQVFPDCSKVPNAISDFMTVMAKY